MNKGLEILLARMDTNPDEFLDGSRWIDTFNQYKKYMPQEEQDLFMAKLRAIKLEQFEQEVVKRLLQYEVREQRNTILAKKQITDEVIKQFEEAYEEYKTRGGF